MTVYKTRLFGAARRSSALFGTQSKMNAPAQHPIRIRPCSATVRLRSSALFGSAVRRCCRLTSYLPPPQVLVLLLVDGGGNPLHDKKIEEKKSGKNLGEI